MEIHCDVCGRVLGDYLYGPGGVEEVAWIGSIPIIGMPDVICNNCNMKIKVSKNEVEI